MAKPCTPANEQEGKGASMQTGPFAQQWALAERRDVAVSIVREKEEQMHALAVSLAIRLTPKNEEDDCDRIALQLARMLEDMLGATEMHDAVQAVLYVPDWTPGGGT